MRAGFTLVEVLIAIVILEVGLLGALGTLTLAQRLLASAERLHLATQVAASTADSLLGERAGGAGERREAWGRVRWATAAGGLEMVAEEEPGAALFVWWIPIAAAP